MAEESPFDTFASWVDQFKEVAGYRSIDVGIVYLMTTPGPAVIALRSFVSRDAPAGRVDEFLGRQAVGVHDRLPIEKLPEMLGQLQSGAISSLAEPLPGGPVALRKDDRWQAENTRWHEHRSMLQSMFQYGLNNLPSGFVWSALDLGISLESNRTIPSLARLVGRFTGLDSSRWQDSEAKIHLPWPIHEAKVDLTDLPPRVFVTGVPGLATERFVLTAESTGGDTRIDGKGLVWTGAETPEGDKRTYAANLPERFANISALHVYFEGLDVVQIDASVDSGERRLMPDFQSGVEYSGSPPPHMGADPGPLRIERLEIEGYRAIRDGTLDLTPPLAVLVGRNQSGKSTLLDALALIREAANGSLSDAISARGLLSRLRHRGRETRNVRFATTISTSNAKLRHTFSLRPYGSVEYVVESESLTVDAGDGPLNVFTMANQDGTYRNKPIHVRDPRELMISQVRDAVAYAELETVRAALASMAVYPGFHVGVDRSQSNAEGIRGSTRLDPAPRLAPSGENLAAVLHDMRETRPDDWQEYLAVVRLVFPTLKTIRTPTVSSGFISILWEDETVSEGLSASELSDGTLQLLCLLAALYQVGDSIVAIDEPEHGLHPDALYRFVSAARKLSTRRPVLLATQSDALMNMLDASPNALVVAERVGGEARFVRPDPEVLKRWAEEYGLASMRHELESWEVDS